MRQQHCNLGALVALLAGLPVSERPRSIFTGANPLAIENKARLESILYSLRLWIEYPFGVGIINGPTYNGTIWISHRIFIPYSVEFLL